MRLVVRSTWPDDCTRINPGSIQLSLDTGLATVWIDATWGCVCDVGVCDRVCVSQEGVCHQTVQPVIDRLWRMYYELQPDTDAWSFQWMNSSHIKSSAINGVLAHIEDHKTYTHILSAVICQGGWRVSNSVALPFTNQQSTCQNVRQNLRQVMEYLHLLHQYWRQ